MSRLSRAPLRGQQPSKSCLRKRNRFGLGACLPVHRSQSAGAAVAQKSKGNRLATFWRTSFSSWIALWKLRVSSRGSSRHWLVHEPRALQSARESTIGLCFCTYAGPITSCLSARCSQESVELHPVRLNEMQRRPVKCIVKDTCVGRTNGLSFIRQLN